MVLKNANSLCFSFVALWLTAKIELEEFIDIVKEAEEQEEGEMEE